MRPRDVDRPRRDPRDRVAAHARALISRFQRIDVEGAADDVVAQIAALAGVASVVHQPDGGIRIEVTEEGVTADVLKLLVDAGVTSVETCMPSLEEVYVQMIGDRGLQV